MRLRLPWAKPPPPPPPPPPPSLHAALGVSGADILLAGAACGALALVLLLLVWLSLRRQPAAGDDAKPLVSVEARDAAKGRVAVVNAPPESTLAPHVRRLLKLRGFAEVRLVDAAAATTDGRRSQGRKALVAACKGADLAVDVAYEAEGTSASSATEMLLRACAGANVRAIVQCSDALVGYDPAEDACDGDESADAGVSLNSPEPKAPVEASGRLLALRRSEDALARHRASSASVATFVLRLHRVYDSSARVLPALVPLLLASWGGVLCGGARAQTNVLHVEDAALAVVLAADRSAASGTDGEAVVVTDPAVWSAAHLLRCAAAVLRVPRPLLPLLAPLRLVASAAALLGLGAPAACVRTVSVHSYFSGERAKASLGFEPAAGSGGLYAALCGLRARCGVALRLVPPLLAAAAALVVDAHSLLLPGVSTAHATPLSAPLSVLAALSLLYALLPPPSKLPAPPALTPPVVSGALPLLGHLLQFMKGPVSMIDDLRVRYRSTFTIYVGPQRITFMIGAGPQLAFIKAKDELLDQAPVYAFTIPVFGKGIVYDSPLDERLQQARERSHASTHAARAPHAHAAVRPPRHLRFLLSLPSPRPPPPLSPPLLLHPLLHPPPRPTRAQVKLLVHTMNTKSLEGMIPKMITEAEDYFGAWGDEGTVELRHVFSELIIMTASACMPLPIPIPPCPRPYLCAISELVIMTASACMPLPIPHAHRCLVLAPRAGRLDGARDPRGTLGRDRSHLPRPRRRSDAALNAVALRAHPVAPRARRGAQGDGGHLLEDHRGAPLGRGA